MKEDTALLTCYPQSSIQPTSFKDSGSIEGMW